jgi:hypothetical protein
MMRHELDTGDGEYFTDIVERIFSAPTKQAALDIIETPMYSSKTGYWNQIIGTRGFKGEKTFSARPMFDVLFEVVEETTNEEVEETLDENALENLLERANRGD